MTQNEVDAFLAVIEYGSISAAARELFVGQPTISARIRALETELNTTLINRERGQRNIELTQAGHNFEPYARKWRQLWNETQTAIRNTQPKQLTITASHSLNAYIMPHVYQILTEYSDKTIFRFTQNPYYRCFHLVESGEADVGFVPTLQFSRTLKISPIIQEAYVVLHGQELDLPPIVHPRQLPAEKEVYVVWDADYNLWHNYWFGIPPKSSVEASDVAFIEYVVLHSDCWAIVPASMVETLGLTCKPLYSRLTDGPAPHVTNMICRQEFCSNPYYQQIIQAFRQVAQRFDFEWLMQF